MRGCTYLSPVCRFGHTRRLRNRTPPDERGEDMTTASLLIVLIAGTAVGAIVGLALGGGIDLWYLALLAGFLGSTIAVLVRNFILARGRAWTRRFPHAG